jgi:hypothetical protein
LPTHAPPEAAAARNADLLLNRDQVEQRYGIPRRWLELAAHKGEGPPYVVFSRRMVRYRVADLEAWMQARRIGGEATAA